MIILARHCRPRQDSHRQRWQSSSYDALSCISTVLKSPTRADELADGQALRLRFDEDNVARKNAGYL